MSQMQETTVEDGFNLAAHVLARGASLPEKSALQILKPSGAERWQYGRLIQAVRGTGTGLLDAGLKPGDKVLIRLGNTADFPVAFLGAIAAGLVPVPTSSQLTQTEIDAIAQQLQPAATIAAPGITVPATPGLLIDQDRLRSFETLAPCDYDTGAQAGGSPDRLAYIVFTSGTQGGPRGVCHAHRAILARHAMHRGWSGLTEHDRILHAGSMNWTYTLGTGLLDPWMLGATALIPASGVEPSQIPLLLKRFDATVFAAVPGIYRKILRDHPKIPLPKLRHGLSAGEKLPEATRSAWTEATGTLIHEAFGMTECSTFISGHPDRPAPLGTMGFIQPGRHVKIDTQGTDDTGEILIHRSDPGLFAGYLNDPVPHDWPEWFATGDLARRTEDGAICYMGRRDDMMNAGGVRVSPLDVEHGFDQLDGIGEVAAVEIAVAPDVTVIALAHTGNIAEDVLKAHAETHLARNRQPRIYRRMEQLPRNQNGKINRRALREDWPTSL